MTDPDAAALIQRAEQALETFSGSYAMPELCGIIRDLLALLTARETAHHDPYLRWHVDGCQRPPEATVPCSCIMEKVTALETALQQSQQSDARATLACECYDKQVTALKEECELQHARAGQEADRADAAERKGTALEAALAIAQADAKRFQRWMTMLREERDALRGQVAQLRSSPQETS